MGLWPPTLTGPLVFILQYTENVPENEADYLVARLTVTDADEKGTAAWRTKYMIVKGNEGGNFVITTDPETNDGLLKTAKVSRGSHFWLLLLSPSFSACVYAHSSPLC